MSRIRLVDKVDLNIYYEADKLQFEADYPTRSVVAREVFINAFKHCPSRGIEVDGVQVGGAIFDGKEAHLAVLPGYQGKWGLVLGAGFEWLMSLQDPIVVCVPRTNKKVIRFCDRNKWMRIKEDDDSITFRIFDHPDLAFHRRDQKNEQRAQLRQTQSDGPESHADT